MGQIRDHPETTKVSISSNFEQLLSSSSGMQGYRTSMEDNHNLFSSVGDEILDSSLKEYLKKNEFNLSFYGIYDGHSGSGCADYVSKNLLKTLLESEKKKIQESNYVIFDDNNAIEGCFIKTDDAYAKIGQSAGSTATTTIIRTKKNVSYDIICANTGDSRTVLYNEGEIKPLSKDHKPNDEIEIKRIKEAGSTVEFGRVNGTLAVSRAFGDHMYKEESLEPKKRAVSCVPDITREKISFKKKNESEYRFVVLACDGIWDVLTNTTCCEFIKKKLQQQDAGDYWELKKNKLKEKLIKDEMEEDEKKKINKQIEECKKKDEKYDLKGICEDVLDHAVLELDSKDNVSIIITIIN